MANETDTGTREGVTTRPTPSPVTREEVEAAVLAVRDASFDYGEVPFASSEARALFDAEVASNDALSLLLTRLFAERDEWHRIATTSGVCELGAHNPNVASYCREWEARAEKAERERERDEAVAALRWWFDRCADPVDRETFKVECQRRFAAVLAKIGGAS